MEPDTVVKMDLGVVPEAAVSGAVLLQSESTTFLTFNAMRPESDGFRHPAGTAILEFPSCSITKFGYPNDEALPGHPLYSKLPGAYAAYEVLASSWIAELEAVNRVAFPQSGNWGNRHFIITFHDSTFECIAEDIRIEVSDEPYGSILHRLAQRIVEE